MSQPTSTFPHMKANDSGLDLEGRLKNHPKSATDKPSKEGARVVNSLNPAPQSSLSLQA